MANESLVMTAEVRDNFSSTLRKLQNELRSLSSTGATSTKTLRQDWKGVASDIQGATGTITRDLLPAMRLGNLAGLTLGGSIGAAALALKGFAEGSVSLNRFSKEVQVGQNELLKLKTLGEFFGQDWMQTQQGVRTFQDFLTRLKRDSGRTRDELITTFGPLGEELGRKLFNAQSMGESLKIAFDVIRSTGNETKARQIAQAVFGNESWARIIRNTTPEIQAELDKITKMYDESSLKAAQMFEINMLKLRVVAENLKNEAMGPLLATTLQLYERFNQPVGDAFKRSWEDMKNLANELAEGLKTVLGWMKQIDEFTSSSFLGKAVGMLPKPGQPSSGTGPTTSDTIGKLNRYNNALTPGPTAPGSPAKTLEKSNEDLKRSTDELKRSTDKQTSLWERIITAAGQGGDTAGLGPGLGGVSAGGGGLGGAGALREFMGGGGGGGGGGGRSIRHGGNAPVGSGGAAVNSWMNFLMKPVSEGGLGRTREQAAGEVASLRGESGSGMEGVSRTWNDPSGRGVAGISGGVASWRNERFRNLQAFAQSKGLDWRSHEAQQGFYRQEMLGDYSGVNARIAGAQTAQEALGIHVRDFERPAKVGPAIAQRSGYINDLMTRNLSGNQAPADLSGLRVKPGATGGGDVAGGVTDAARWMQTNLPGFNRVTSMNDAFHQRLRRNSAHKSGLAIDATIGDPRQSAAAAQQIRDELIAKGLDPSDFRVIDEYKRLSRGGTGGHIHTQFNSAEAAERYRKASLLQQQGKAEAAQQSKLEANGTVNIHLNDGMRDKNAKVDTDGMFKDVKVNRGKPMATAEDMGPLNRASAGF